MIPVLAKDISCFDAFVKSKGEEQIKKGESKSYMYLFGYPDDLLGDRKTDLIRLTGWMENPKYGLEHLKCIMHSVPGEAYDKAVKDVKSILKRFGEE